MSRPSVIVVGGGIIGLSIAYELQRRGTSVQLLEQDQPGRKASWAGAGMLPVANAATALHPLEHLAALSNQLHSQWSAELLQLTGIDNHWRISGGLHLARTKGEVASLLGAELEWDQRKIPFQRVDDQQLERDFSPLLSLRRRSSTWLAIEVPGDALFSNQQHLRGLVSACQLTGVDLVSDLPELSVEFRHGNIATMISGSRRFEADQFIIAAGPWTESLLHHAGTALPMQPVRGQIALFQIEPAQSAPVIDGPIINEGTRYLVPRHDGYVLAGSTIEEAGFDCTTTEEELGPLCEWAQDVLPAIAGSAPCHCWAGLRPATYDGFPYLGRLTGSDNTLIATGHFKSGLQLSTGTAVTIADLALGIAPEIDLVPFDPGRVNGAQHHFQPAAR